MASSFILWQELSLIIEDLKKSGEQAGSKRTEREREKEKEKEREREREKARLTEWRSSSVAEGLLNGKSV